MRTVRRLYFYAVAIVSLEIVIWGMVGLARSFFCGQGMAACGAAAILARGLALILVGLPVFGFHWWMAERFARREVEERSSGVRAAFLYGALLGTLIPIVQSTLSLLDRLALQAVGLSSSQVILGPNQTWSDNLIAIVINAIVAAYFVVVLRADWRAIALKDAFIDIRRIYRHVWLIYSLALVIASVQQLLQFILNGFAGEFVYQYRSSGAHGIVLALIGVPLWYFVWKTLKEALVEQAERESTLRLGILYFLSLAGVVAVLASGGVVIDVIFRVVLGESVTISNLIQKVTGPLSIGIPLAGVWAYYGGWLDRAITESAEAPRRAGMRRLYSYILSVIGLGAAFIGLGMLLAFVVDASIGKIVWANVLRPRLAAALSTLFVGLPLWWLAWRQMQKGAQATGDEGDHARRSIIRKVYLYLALFVSVVGGMITAVGALNLLLRSLLGNPLENLLQQVLHNLVYLFLFIGLGLYHGTMLGKDGKLASKALAEKHALFPVLIFDPGDGAVGQAVLAALHKQMPRLPAVIQTASQPVPQDATPKAVLIPGDLAIDPPELLRKWLDQYYGDKLIIPQAAKGWLWAGGIRPLQVAASQAAQAVRQLAEGQEVRQQAGTSAWMIVLYIFAGLFGLEVLSLLIALGISRLVG